MARGDMTGERAIRRPGRPRSSRIAIHADNDPPVGGIVIDRLKSVLFPNRVREQRVRAGHLKLLAFAVSLPDIPYIRLSKIERGEVFPRAVELGRIARILDIAPEDLLVDVDAPDFDLETWFAPFADAAALDNEEEATFAILLAAAMRARREASPELTAPHLDSEFGIAPVVLSRIENAQKGLARWNAQTVMALCQVFGVRDEPALRAHLTMLHRSGALDRFIPAIGGPEQRTIRTRERIAALRRELRTLDPHPAPMAHPVPMQRQPVSAAARLVPVHGGPIVDGLMNLAPTGTQVEAPAVSGPRAFGVRVGRPTLGGGLPGHATVIVDPDRYPQAGGLALVRDGDGHRLVSVSLDRDGVMKGYSLSPEREIVLDTLPPTDIAAVVAALFV